MDLQNRSRQALTRTDKFQHASVVIKAKSAFQSNADRIRTPGERSIGSGIRNTFGL